MINVYQPPGFMQEAEDTELDDTHLFLLVANMLTLLSFCSFKDCQASSSNKVKFSWLASCLDYSAFYMANHSTPLKILSSVPYGFATQNRASRWAVGLLPVDDKRRSWCQNVDQFCLV